MISTKTHIVAAVDLINAILSHVWTPSNLAYSDDDSHCTKQRTIFISLFKTSNFFHKMQNNLNAYW